MSKSTKEQGFVTEEMEQNAVAVVDNKAEVLQFDDKDFAGTITSRAQSFCSFEAKTVQEKAQLFNATNTPDFRIGDEINKVIKIKDIYAENVTCRNAETGEENVCPRIVLIDDKGKGHTSVSMGVFGAVKKLMQSFGTPNMWDAPIPVEIKQITKGNNKILTFSVKF